jgi:hypothetical protein
MKCVLATLVLLPAMMAQTAQTTGKAAAAPRADPLDGLVADSPFLSPAGGMRSAAATSTGPLELRSVVFVDGAYQFSIFDQGTGESDWVRIGEGGYPFVARSFNRERDALTVEHQGRTLVLALQPAKMASGAAAQPQSQPPLPGPGDATNRKGNPPPGQGPPHTAANASNNAPTPPGATSAAEAQRLQNLADEIRRRRGTGSQMNLPQPRKN